MNLKNIWRRLRGKHPIRMVEYQMGVDYGVGESVTAYQIVAGSHVQCRCIPIPTDAPVVTFTNDPQQAGFSWTGRGPEFVYSFEQPIEDVQFFREQIARAFAIPPALFAPDNPPGSVDDNPGDVLG